MANFLIGRTLRSIRTPSFIYRNRHFSSIANVRQNEREGSASSFTFDREKDDSIYVKAPNDPSQKGERASSVTMPTSFMTGSIVGKRFYQKGTTREADDGNGWTVMLDYRTLKTPSKRPLKLPTLALAKAIAAEWEYQVLSLLCLNSFHCCCLITFFCAVGVNHSLILLVVCWNFCF